MSAKSFLYPGAKLAEKRGRRIPFPEERRTNEPSPWADLEDIPTPEPFTVLRTEDTEKRLTEREGNDDQKSRS